MSDATDKHGTIADIEAETAGQPIEGASLVYPGPCDGIHVPRVLGAGLAPPASGPGKRDGVAVPRRPLGDEQGHLPSDTDPAEGDPPPVGLLQGHRVTGPRPSADGPRPFPG